MISEINTRIIVAKIEQALNTKGVGIAVAVKEYSENGVFVLDDNQVSVSDNECYGFYLRYTDPNLAYKPLPHKCGFNYLQVAKIRLVLWKPCDKDLHSRVLNAFKPLSSGFILSGDERVSELLLTASSSEVNTVKKVENLKFNTELSMAYFDFTISIRLSSNCQNTTEIC